MSARKTLYNYIAGFGLGKISGEKLREIGHVSDWARVLRQLKQDEVINYRYDPRDNSYEILSVGPYSIPTKRTGLSSKDRYRIRNRDGHKCQACGKGVSDGVKLHVDHKIPLDWGGGNNDENLWTLCEECNLGKKAFFTDDFDPQIMRLVNEQESGFGRLKVLFENSPRVKFTPSVLQGISGIRDWTRTIRHIRKDFGLNIVWVPEATDFPDGYYEFVPK